MVKRGSEVVVKKPDDLSGSQHWTEGMKQYIGSATTVETVKRMGPLTAYTLEGCVGKNDVPYVFLNTDIEKEIK